jgi:hypothetical protein
MSGHCSLLIAGEAESVEISGSASVPELAGAVPAVGERYVFESGAAFVEVWERASKVLK